MKLDAGIYEFMKAFRDDRLAKMDSGDIPVSLAEGPTTVLHVLPASVFEPGASVNLSAVAHERSLTGLAGEQWSLSYDFEGVLVWDSSASEDTRSYVQLFRNGVLEMGDTALLAAGGEGERNDIGTFEGLLSETAPMDARSRRRRRSRTDRAHADAASRARLGSERRRYRR